MRRSSMTIALVIASMVAVTTGTAWAATPALSPSPNTSMVLYKLAKDGTSGRLRTGTLVDGVFTQKASFRTGRWSDIAIGRDTMAMYDRKSGRLVTGTLIGGRFRQKASRRLGKGYTHVAASCDSIAFYKRSAGLLRTAELMHGQIRDLRTTSETSASVDLMDASCDTLIRREQNFADAGVLTDGYHVSGGGLVAMSWSHLATNRTSALGYRRSDGSAEWWRSMNGEFGPRTGFALSTDLDIIAGVGDGMVFYNGTTGATYHWRLVDGALTDIGPGPSYGKGLTLIAGGR